MSQSPEEPTSPGSKLPIIPLVLAVVAAMLAGFAALGGAAFYLVKSGRLSGLGSPSKVVEAHGEPERTKLIALDPLLVNLSDPDGKGYLRVTLVLRVEDPPPSKAEKAKAEDKAEKGRPVLNENDVLLRDAALGVIGRENGDQLLAVDGKERLKTELRSAFASHVPGVKVLDVLLTDFLVQR